MQIMKMSQWPADNLFHHKAVCVCVWALVLIGVVCTDIGAFKLKMAHCTQCHKHGARGNIHDMLGQEHLKHGLLVLVAAGKLHGVEMEECATQPSLLTPPQLGAPDEFVQVMSMAHVSCGKAVKVMKGFLDERESFLFWSHAQSHSIRM